MFWREGGRLGFVLLKRTQVSRGYSPNNASQVYGM